MQEIITAFFEIVVWGFVPAMASIILREMHHLSQLQQKDETQLSMRAGFWGGLVLFLIIFVAQIGHLVQSGFPDAAIYQGFNPFLALGAAIAVFALFYGRYKIPPWLRGWLVLGITALALWTFMHYLFIHTANIYILSLALGTALGLFTHKMLFPGKRFI